jgi:hypothetical protein
MALYLLAWIPAAALLAVIFAAHRPRAEAVWLAVPLAFAAAFLGLGPWFLCRALPLGTTPASRLLSAHAAAIAVACAAWLGIGGVVASVLDRGAPGALDRFRVEVPFLAGVGALLFALAAVVHYLMLAFERSRAAERAALELQLAARDAELEALRAQLDPHFMFNSLNTIVALIQREPDTAQRMCVRLAEFLRTTARVGKQRTITLAEELNLASTYLDIERARFGARLRVEVAMPPEAGGCEVPPLLLQPLVENAVRHGIAHELDGGTIRIAVERRDGELTIDITNPCAPDRPAAAGGGTGLANARERLLALHPGIARLDTKESGGRFQILVRLPAQSRMEVG